MLYVAIAFLIVNVFTPPRVTTNALPVAANCKFKCACFCRLKRPPIYIFSALLCTVHQRMLSRLGILTIDTWILYIGNLCLMNIRHHCMFIFILCLVYSCFFRNKAAGQGRPGPSRGECHSSWPFRTCHGGMSGLVARAFGHSTWLPCPGSFAKPPGPGKASKPPHACGRTRFHMCTHTCTVEPTKSHIRRQIGLSSQSVLDSRVVNNPGPSWDFCPGLLRLARSPPCRRTILSLVWLSFPDRRARRPMPDYRH